MEKKTFGKFISALRKANGMTQKELGEKLFVSDKTVSRWECDECTPELSLIPLIAEIFGITTDELLRGERNNPDRLSLEVASKHKNLSDKQFKLMLEQSSRKYKNFTLIAVGIMIFGFIAAMIANLGFSKGLIAFCLALAFCVVSELCQLCFAINARISVDGDDNLHSEEITKANNDVVNTAVSISFANLSLLAFSLPLVTLINGAYSGLTFSSWLLSGFIFAAVCFAVCYIIYNLFINKALYRRNKLVLNEDEINEIARKNALLKKTMRNAILVALVIGVCIGVWNIIGWKTFLKEYTFDNCNDFKAFMENDYNRWFNEGYGYANVNGETVVIVPDDPNYSHNEANHCFVYGSITDSQGEEICSYYYNPDLYYKIDFTPSSDDKMPVTVVRRDDVENAWNVFFTVESLLGYLMVVDFVVCTAVYIFNVKKSKNNV